MTTPPRPAICKKLAQAQVVVMNGLGLEEFLAAPREKKSTPRPRSLTAAKALILCPCRAACRLLRMPDTTTAMSIRTFLPDRGKPPPWSIISPQAWPALILKGRRPIVPPPRTMPRACFPWAAVLPRWGACAPRKGIVLQHDALAYLVHDAGLEVMDVIQESEDVQPSAARLMELVRRIREEKPVLIAGEPQYSDKPAQTWRAKPACPQRSLIPWPRVPPMRP